MPIRSETSVTEDSEALAQDLVQVHEQEVETIGYKILKNVTDIVPVKYTPVVSSKQSRSSSCIFKGSHIKADETSR